jgi:hypothetical protein
LDLGFNRGLFIAWVVRCRLDPVEALHVVVGQRAPRLFILNESNHGSVAKGIEFVIIVGLDVFDRFGSLFKEFGANVLFESISVVCNESLSTIKLNFESLIVEWHPSTATGSSA